MVEARWYEEWRMSYREESYSTRHNQSYAVFGGHHVEPSSDEINTATLRFCNVNQCEGVWVYVSGNNFITLWTTMLFLRLSDLR